MDRLIASAAASTGELPETRSSGFDDQGASIDANLPASMLAGTERIVLDPGSRTP